MKTCFPLISQSVVRLSSALALPLLAVTTPVQAQLGSPDANTWKLELSVGAIKGTQSFFKGVMLNSRTDPLIGIEVAKGRWFGSTLNGIGYLLADSASFSLGVSANYMLGRQESYEARYRGMGNVEGTAAAYGFFEWRPIKDAVTVYGNAMRSARSQNGSLATLGATLALPVSGRLSAFADLNATWADNRYAQTYYGVTAAQAATSGYRTSAVQSGILNTTPSIGLDYAANKNWELIGYVGRTRLGTNAAASPMVQNRSQPVAAMLATYKF